MEFEDHRRYLRAVAYRMLGSLADVDDAVQECWLRARRAPHGRPVALMAFTVGGGRIVEIIVYADPADLRRWEVRA